MRGKRVCFSFDVHFVLSYDLVYPETGKAFSFYSLTSMRACCLNFYIWRGNYLDI